MTISPILSLYVFVLDLCAKIISVMFLVVFPNIHVEGLGIFAPLISSFIFVVFHFVLISMED